MAHLATCGALRHLYDRLIKSRSLSRFHMMRRVGSFAVFHKDFEKRLCCYDLNDWIDGLGNASADDAVSFHGWENLGGGGKP